VKFAFTFRSEVFAGKPQEEGGEWYLNTTEGITLRLLEKYGWVKLKGANLSTDNLYTSVSLAEKLLEKKMTLVGTLRSNRKGITKEMKNMDGREENSTVVWWEKERGKMTLTSYVVNTKSKGKKNVLVLSTIPALPDMGVTKDDGKKKPAVIKLYDYTKGEIVTPT
jgi:hypothetical protein